MSKTENKTNNQTQNVDEATLRAQIEAEMREKIEAEVKAKLKTEIQTKNNESEAQEDKQQAVMEKHFEKQEKTMKQILAKEKKVKIFIPENPLNPNEVVPVGLNGVIYAIPTGQEFEVPESIYNVWKYSFDKTREANKKMDMILNKEIKIME